MCWRINGRVAVCMPRKRKRERKTRVYSELGSAVNNEIRLPFKKTAVLFGEEGLVRLTFAWGARWPLVFHRRAHSALYLLFVWPATLRNRRAEKRFPLCLVPKGKCKRDYSGAETSGRSRSEANRNAAIDKFIMRCGRANCGFHHLTHQQLALMNYLCPPPPPPSSLAVLSS